MMNKSARVSLLIVVLIIATFLRFYHFTTTPPGLYPDEAIDGNNAVEVAETGHFQPFYIEDNGREGLYVNILAVALKEWPIYEPWMIRLPAAIAGVLTVWGLYLLVAELFGSATGLLAAFFLATSFWHINFSRIGFRAILAPLLLTWALYLLIKAFRVPSEKNSRSKGFLYAALAGVIYSLGFYTYIAYRVTPLLFLLFIPFFKKYPDFWKRVAAFLVITFLVAAPIGWYFAKHPGDFFGRTSQISVTNSGNPIGHLALNIIKTALMFNVHGDDNWRHNISGAPELFWPVGMLFLIGIMWECYMIWRQWRKQKSQAENASAVENTFPLFSILLTFSWLILAILPEAASDEGIPHALRAILAIPPAMILASVGGVWCYRTIKERLGKNVARGSALLLLAYILIFGYINYFVIWAKNPNVPGAFNADYVTIGDEINALPASTPKYVVVTAAGVPIRGIPTPAETTMFIAHSFTIDDQMKENIVYLLPSQTNRIPTNTPSSTVFFLR